MPSPSEKTNSTSDAKRWFGLYSKPLHEKRLAQRLNVEVFEMYYPLEWELRQRVTKERVKELSIKSPFFICRLDKDLNLLSNHYLVACFGNQLYQTAIFCVWCSGPLKSQLNGGQVENVERDHNQRYLRVPMQLGQLQNEQVAINYFRITELPLVTRKFGIQVSVDLFQSAGFAN